MRDTWSKAGLRGRVVLGLVAAVVLAPAAWAYVNGGDYYNTYRDHVKSLKGARWAVSGGTFVSTANKRAAFLPPGYVGVARPKEADFERDVNQLVGRALKALPEKEAAKLSAEAKRAVARLTREAIRDAVSGSRQVIKKGRIGSLRYQVGAYAYESWWETNYGGKHKVHARTSGLAPLVALKIDAPKG